MKITVHYYNGETIRDLVYNDVAGIKAGTAEQILGRRDAIGNGLPINAPVVQIVFKGYDGKNEYATFNADNVTITD